MGIALKRVWRSGGVRFGVFTTLVGILDWVGRMEAIKSVADVAQILWTFLLGPYGPGLILAVGLLLIGRGVIRNAMGSNESISDIMSRVTVEANGSPFLGGGTRYPILTIPIRIISKVHSVLTIMDITADVWFGGLFVGHVHYRGADGKEGQIEAMGNKLISFTFAPPLQVFLNDLATTCELRNGRCKLHCNVGDVTITLETHAQEVREWERTTKAVKVAAKGSIAGGALNP